MPARSDVLILLGSGLVYIDLSYMMRLVCVKDVSCLKSGFDIFCDMMTEVSSRQLRALHKCKACIQEKGDLKATAFRTKE
jgi:hypothetical protein